MVEMGRGRKLVGLVVFPLGLPKLNLPKLGENENENEEQKVLGILNEIT